MRTSESIKELATALAKAQGEIRDAIKDRTNPHFKSQYATLASVWESCRGPLSLNGLSVIQSPSTDNGMVRVVSLLLHSSGEWVRDELLLTPRDASPQSFGSAITYGRRYSLMAFVGVAPGEDDDDGNAASIPNKPAVSVVVATKSALLTPPLGTSSPGLFIVPFGVNKGRQLSQLKSIEIENDLVYWTKRIASEGKPPTQKLSEYITAMSAYLGSPSIAEQLPPQDDAPMFDDAISFP